MIHLLGWISSCCYPLHLNPFRSCLCHGFNNYFISKEFNVKIFWDLLKTHLDHPCSLYWYIWMIVKLCRNSFLHIILIGISFKMQIWNEMWLANTFYWFSISYFSNQLLCHFEIKFDLKNEFSMDFKFYFIGKLCNWFSFWALLCYMLLKWNFQLVLIYSSTCLSMIRNILRNLISVNFNCYIWELPNALHLLHALHWYILCHLIDKRREWCWGGV